MTPPGQEKAMYAIERVRVDLGQYGYLMPTKPRYAYRVTKNGRPVTYAFRTRREAQAELERRAR